MTIYGVVKGYIEGWGGGYAWLEVGQVRVKDGGDGREGAVRILDQIISKKYSGSRKKEREIS